MVANIKTKVSLSAIILRGQTKLVGLNPKGMKLIYVNIIPNNNKSEVAWEDSKTSVHAFCK